MANLAGLLALCLHLLSLSVASQQWQDSRCTSSGPLPAAEMFLGTTSAKEGDTVSGRCFIPTGASVTIIFFCKDGLEISRLQARRGKFSYDLAYRVTGSSGNISCGYIYRNDDDQVSHSQQSVTQYLKVKGASPRSSPTENSPLLEQENITILIITVSASVGVVLFLLVPLVYYLKKKKVVIKKKQERLQSLRVKSNKVTEDEYSDNNFGESHGLDKEAPDPIYQNLDIEDVPRSSHRSEQKYKSAFHLYENNMYTP
nr:uncharacterized protein LOC106732819 [Pelodiscus sinensis]|eukprot:XP_014435024.1 uncharacterized protein LOC106732819 [Pelodiscus sinensis]